MSEFLIITYITAGTSILCVLLKIMSDWRLKRYRKMKDELDLYKELERGYVELFRIENPKYYKKTFLATLRELRKRLRGMAYRTPGYKHGDDDDE